MNIVLLIGIVITVATAIPVLAQMRHHPRGLVVLFFAEMWERFSYYGMRAILIFYLTQHLLFDDQLANGTYGSYTSLVYLLPLVGGLLADRYIGTRKAVAFGALLLVAGHFLMGVEGAPAKQFLSYEGQRYEFLIEGRGDTRDVGLLVDGRPYQIAAGQGGGLAIQNMPAGGVLPAQLPAGSYQIETQRDPFFTGLFYLALSLIIMGVGYLKPNISTIVGQLYPQGDPRRDPGFTLYYYGINLGAFWATILCGLLGETIGWWAGFGLAGVGMLAGLIVFMRGKARLEGHGEPPNPAYIAARVFGPVTREHIIYLGGILGVGVVWLLIQHSQAVGTMLTLGSLAVLAYVGIYMATKCTRVERERMGLALILIAGSVVFFTLFEQAGSSLNLFADRNTQLPNNGFFSMTASQTQSFNPGFILIFAPFFAWLWVKLAQRYRDPDPLIKFGLGLLQAGLGFLVLVYGAGFADENYRLPLVFLGMAYLLHTTGELCLSPVGLSEMTKLSVPALVSTMMAIWFLASSWAQYFAGFIAQMAGTETIAGEVLDPALALRTSLSVFNWIGWIGVASGALFFILSPLLRHWQHGVNEPPRQYPEPITPTPSGGRQAVSPETVRADRRAT
jgi:POT family proton-dependent oligopeptide transporter